MSVVHSGGNPQSAQFSSNVFYDGSVIRIDATAIDEVDRLSIFPLIHSFFSNGRKVLTGLMNDVVYFRIILIGWFHCVFDGAQHPSSIQSEPLSIAVSL
jgi:hypothetical protein